MKKQLLVCFLALLCSAHFSKAQHCEDFNNPVGYGWFDIVSNFTYDFTNTLDGTRFAKLEDLGGSSHFQNVWNYRNLGDSFPGYCICWDYKILDDGDPYNTIPVFPRIYFIDNTGRKIYFEANFSVTELSDWVKICAPIGFCDPATGTLPSNSQGSWYIPSGTGYTCTDFNYIMTNNQRISFDVDIIGSPSEFIGFDNVCVTSECVSCNNDFKMVMIQNSDPTSVLPQYKSEVKMIGPSPTSTYSIDWGDGTIAASTPPSDHAYPTSGTYTLCVTELQNMVPVCRTCMDYCFGPSTEDAIGGSVLACHSAFTLQVNMNTDPTVISVPPNHYAQITLNSMSPASTYTVDWGDGSPVTTSFSHTYPGGSGTYTVCVTESVGGVPICRTCITFCMGVPYYSGILIGGNGNRVLPASGKGDKTPDKGSSIDNAINIYPNPATKDATIEFSLNSKEIVKIKIMDIAGKVITEIPEKIFDKGIQSTNINVEKLSPGIYTVEVAIGNKLTLTKLLIGN